MAGMTFNEAPASFNVKVNKDGYDCMLTLRSADTRDLMNRALAAIQWLRDNGFEPTNGNGTSNAPTCPTHGKPMKRSKYNGGWYCPVKIADDGGDGKPVYCKQKVTA